ncbi:MAG: NAD(P)H-dependent oxidoreductase [Mycobacteriales bacterium]
MQDLTIVGVVASPQPGGRTATALSAMLAGAEAAGATTRLVELADASLEEVTALMDGADAVVFGSPVYRASYSAHLKQLLERTERGRHGEGTAPLRGKATALVMTGASGHHFLATDGLRAVLATFFAAQTLSPALYLDHKDFTEDKGLAPGAEELARTHGTALVDLTAAVRTSVSLRGLEPLV